ncbi:MAG: MFS transporter [Anaerolineales bacterium]|nr:MFS transporter [Anaerolineales bacterium]
MFGIGIMQLVLATAMPVIVTEIGGDYLYSWVFSSYMLASLLTIPIFSKMADLYGRKKFYLLGMSIFAVGTLYGGLAPTMEHLIVARVLQGLGAGMMTPVSIALISDLFPAEKRGRMIGMFSFVQLLANLISPILGSVITRQLGWHWIFFFTLGMVLTALLLVAMDKSASQQSSQPVSWINIDLLGGSMFGLFCVFLVSFSDSVSNLGQLNLSGILLLIGAIVTGLILVWNESRHNDPIIKLEFFQTKVLRQSIFSSLIAGGIMYGLIMLLPLCNAILKQRGFDVGDSQLLLIFMIGTTLGLLITSSFITKLSSIFPKILWGVSILGAGGMYFAISASNFILFEIITGFLGLTLGGISATLLINSQNAVSNEDRTVLSGLVQLGRYLGAAVGVTVLTGILPDISQINNVNQFLGAFGILIGMYILGLVNQSM